ncbi:heterokaryon incompatibility protein-domain-containing protein [Nemania abortiva]|nr:heterokaryon incompatibility protein-domain-containing protein [Nemania abortiva]
MLRLGDCTPPQGLTAKYLAKAKNFHPSPQTSSVVSLKSISTRQSLVEVYEHCPQRPYVELTVPPYSKAVTAVSFTTLSRDQGWASDKTTSFSGFEVRLRRPEGRYDLGPIKIHSNRVANPEPFQVTARLDINTEPAYSRRSVWIRELRPGDVIQLIPKAMFLGWVNIVLDASIEVEYQSLTAIPKPVTRPTPTILYQQLRHRDRQIRVLVVKPGLFDDIVQARFETISLTGPKHEQESFHAFSYCWGNPLHNVGIALENGSGVGSGLIPVTRTIERMIRRFRSRDKPLRIWVDALCINQNDHEERSQQVSIMGSIYSRAKMVHVWLGDEDSSLEAALRVFHDIYNYNRGDCPGGYRCCCSGPTKHTVRIEDLEDIIQRQGYVSTFFMYEIFEYHRPRHFDAHTIQMSGGREPHFGHLIHAFFLTPWFHRVWVVQEALLARRTFVHSGAEMIGWWELLVVNDLIKSNDDLLRTPTLDFKMTMPVVWEGLASGGNQGAESLSILDVFLAALDLKASDPRDKLFGLLALGRETRVADLIPPVLRPDYTKTLARVMADFTRWWIIEHNSLDILSFIHCQPTRAWRRTLGNCDERLDMPITRPTWALSPEGHSDWSRMTLIKQFPSLFQAAGDKTKNIPLEERDLLYPGSEPLQLILRGRTIAVIAAIAHPPKEMVEPYSGDSANTAAAHGGELLRVVFCRMFDPCGEIGAWSRQGNRKREGSRVSPAQLRRAFDAHVAAHAPYIHQPQADNKGRFYERYRADDGLPSCIEPCFFVTSNGLYGLCPWRAKKGDVVAILHGGRVPYLLRLATAPHGTREAKVQKYELVGECFMVDLMNGEGMKAAVGKAETFTLV